jgi:PAS domain S-box-containing protein
MILSENRTLLLVEDEALIAEDEAKQLTDEGYRVIIASSGEKAIDIVRTRGERIDLILMDINLGKGLDGAETAREILKGRDIPILFLSSHTEKEVVDKTGDISSYGFVVKDSGFTVLQASVNMAFKLHQAYMKRREVEEKLRTSEMFNFALFQFNPIPTVIVDREGRIVKTNLAQRESGDRMPNIGDLMYREYAGKHGIDMRGELMACLASGKPAQFHELPYENKILSVAIAPFSGGAIITSQDVTERVRAAKKVRLSEKRLALAQQAAGAGVFNWERATNRLTLSPELYAIFGKSPDDPEDPFQIWENILHLDDKPALRRRIEEAVKNRLSIEEEFRIVRGDGQIHWLRMMGNASYEASGTAVRVDGICLDITGYKFRDDVRAAVYEISEVALRAETLEEIFKTLHQIISRLIPAENFYIALYDAEKKMLSFPYYVDEYDEPPAPQPIGRGCTEYVLFHGEPLHITPQKSEELEQAGEVVLIGAPAADWLGVPLKIRGQTIGVMVVQTYVAGAMYGDEDQDILTFVSGQAALSIERKRSENALQQLVKQKELLMRELQHRTKNSLALVSSLLGLEKEGLPDARSREIFSKTRARIGSIATVYERLSDSANYDRVKLHVYLQEIAEAVLRSFAPETGTVRLKTKLEEMTLDPKRAVPVGLIVNELVMNSLKYGFAGKPKGEIRLELKKDGNRVILEVSDNGVGVSKDFDFKNATGSGLTIVRMLVEQIDGELSFTVDHGTRVQMSFID